MIGKRLIVLLLLALVSALPAWAQQDQQQTVNSALATIERMRNDAGFKEDFQPKLDQARAVMIVPALYKGGFIFGGQYGNGVLLSRLADGSWSYPAFYTLEGGSFGLQIGLESTAVLFIIMDEKGLQAVLNNQFKFGADIYAFSLTGVGLYGGLSLEGTVLSARESWNAAYYGQNVASRAIVLDNSVSNPKADALRDFLAH